jgi:hypothetical protein
VPHSPSRRSTRLSAVRLEDRVNPTHDPFGDFFHDDPYYDDPYYDDPFWYDDSLLLDDPFWYDSILIPDFAPPPPEWADVGLAWFALGTDAGGPPEAVLLDGAGAEVLRVTAYDPSFLGGVRVAVGDVNGDGVPDLITAPGPGMAPVVKVFSGAGGSLIHEFLAFEESFTGGVFAAAGDFNLDGAADLILSPDQGGGPRVRVLDGRTLTPITDFFGIEDPDFRGGARVAVGDVNGDLMDDLVVAAGYGGGPRVAVFDGVTVPFGDPGKVVPDFFAFEDTLRNGAYTAIGDLNDDGFGDLIFGGGPGGAPRVMALDGLGLLGGAYDPLANFFAGNLDDRSGVRVGVSTGGDAGFNILAAAAAGGSAGRYDLSGNTLSFYDPFGGYDGGLYLGSAPQTTRSTTVQTTSTRTPATGTTEFNHYVVISNLKGNYSGMYNTTIWDEKAPAGSQQKVVRVEVVLTIDNVTPDSPNSDPERSNGGNYRWTGTATVRPAGYRSMTVSVNGVYTCTQFPTPFAQQRGSLSIFTQGSGNIYTRSEVSSLNADVTGGVLTASGFAFSKLNEYGNYANPTGTLVLRK